MAAGRRTQGRPRRTHRPAAARAARNVDRPRRGRRRACLVGCARVAWAPAGASIVKVPAADPRRWPRRRRAAPNGRRCGFTAAPAAPGWRVAGPARLRPLLESAGLRGAGRPRAAGGHHARRQPGPTPSRRALTRVLDPRSRFRAASDPRSTSARAARTGHGARRCGCVHCGFCLAGMPDLSGARRRDGLAARAHRPDEGGARGQA